MGNRQFDFNAAIDDIGGVEALWRLIDLAAEEGELNRIEAHLNHASTAAVEIRKLHKRFGHMLEVEAK